MIDAEARLELLAEAGAATTSPSCCSTSCSATAPTPTRRRSWPRPAPRWVHRGGPLVVVYVLGTDRDPQGLDRQRAAFREAGCLVAPTGARAALAAAAIALRRPELVEIALS